MLARLCRRVCGIMPTCLRGYAYAFAELCRRVCGIMPTRLRGYADVFAVLCRRACGVMPTCLRGYAYVFAGLCRRTCGIITVLNHFLTCFSISLSLRNPVRVIPAPAFAGVNLSPRRRGAGIHSIKGHAYGRSAVADKTGFPLEFIPMNIGTGMTDREC